MNSDRKIIVVGALITLLGLSACGGGGSSGSGGGGGVTPPVNGLSVANKVSVVEAKTN